MNQKQAALIVRMNMTDADIATLYPDADPKWYGLIREWGERGGQMLTGSGPISDPFFNNPSGDYRFAPRTVTITGPGGTFEIPEPVREPLREGRQYWMADFAGVGNYIWRDDRYDKVFLAQGRIHLTEEAAQAHAVALAKLMQKEVKP